MPSFSNVISILTAFVVTSSITTTVGSTNDFNPRRLASKNSKKNATPQSRCNAQLFEGMWMYKNCNDATVLVTMGCTDNNKDTCSYRENNFADEGNFCPIGGTFDDKKTGSNVSYNDNNGRCEIGYFPFTEDPCGISPRLGMKAYIDMNKDGRGGHPGRMHLLFSEDGGDTFYNADGDVRVATRMSSDDHHDRRRDLIVEEKEEQLETSSSWSVTTDPSELQRRRLECSSIEGVRECTHACQVEKDKKTKKLGRDCCIHEKLSGKCILNKNDSTCKCNNEPYKDICYIDMTPVCSKECQDEKDEDGKDSRTCCEDRGQSEKCILNSNSSTCKCNKELDRCYIDMRCKDNETWQSCDDNYSCTDKDKDSWKSCRVKPGEKCGLSNSDSNGCTEGYYCSGNPLIGFTCKW